MDRREAARSVCPGGCRRGAVPADAHLRGAVPADAHLRGAEPADAHLWRCCDADVKGETWRTCCAPSDSDPNGVSRFHGCNRLPRDCFAGGNDSGVLVDHLRSERRHVSVDKAVSAHSPRSHRSSLNPRARRHLQLRWADDGDSGEFGDCVPRAPGMQTCDLPPRISAEK